MQAWYRRWRRDGTWERINEALRQHVRRHTGRLAFPRPWAVHSQSVKTVGHSGDKDFDGDGQRMDLIDRDINPVIPNKGNRLDPCPFDAQAHRARDMAERLINKLKQFRRIATRYDKANAIFRGMIRLALAFIRARSPVVNTTQFGLSACPSEGAGLYSLLRLNGFSYHLDEYKWP